MQKLLKDLCCLQSCCGKGTSYNIIRIKSGLLDGLGQARLTDHVVSTSHNNNV